MITLGLSCFGYNPAAALLRDGKLVAFAEEERFVRVKGAFGRFPGRAIQYSLEEAGLPFSAVDRIAVGWDASKYRWFMPVFFAKTWLRYGLSAGATAHGSIWNELVMQNKSFVLSRIQMGLREVGISGSLPTVEFVPHHLAHAASAYYASGFENSAILVIDGSGEEQATSAYTGEKKEIREQWHTDIPHSLGWYYAAITAYLGFKPYEEEGFVMGLAPYGKLRNSMVKKLRMMLWYDTHGAYSVAPQYTLLGIHRQSEHFSEELVRLLGHPRLPGAPLTAFHKDIARATQYILEEVILSLVRRVTHNGQVRRLSLAGGVALNCKANGVIAESGLVDELFVQPASSDAGAALGAAMVVAARKGEDPRFSMRSAQWGPQFSKLSVQNVLNRVGIFYTQPADIAKKAAHAVAKGKIVAWFEGRAEVGPRALGGRSILADPRKKTIANHLNTNVKFREPWRPYCPSMLPASLSYLQKPLEARFMTVTYHVDLARRPTIPAVVHIDGTTRPQVVSPQIQPRYSQVLRAFEHETGVPLVLNTSLNVKGEPIACTPTDAIRCLFSSAIDVLAIEGMWVEKR